MFWRKPAKDPQPATPAPPPAEPPTVAVDDVLDASAAILRALGNHAFSIEDRDRSDVDRTFERWAQHVLVVAPLDEGEARPEGAPPSRRQWRRLVQLVVDHRKGERAFVDRTTTEAREAIWALVDTVGRACSEHGVADRELRARAARLGEAAERDSIADLKREAITFADGVVRFLEEQNQRLAEQTRDLRERLARLETQLDVAKREGGTDPLTKLANRRVFEATLEQQVTLSSVVGRPLTLVLIDLDHFKSVNDRHGHPAGDKVLCEVADTIVRAFPRRTDLVARYGGEEFACVLTETNESSGRQVAERMAAMVRARAVPIAGGATLRLSVSAGVASFRPGDSPADLVARADRRLYAAKQGGRDRVVSDDAPAPGVAPVPRPTAAAG